MLKAAFSAARQAARISWRLFLFQRSADSSEASCHCLPPPPSALRYCLPKLTASKHPRSRSKRSSPLPHLRLRSQPAKQNLPLPALVQRHLVAQRPPLHAQRLPTARDQMPSLTQLPARSEEHTSELQSREK